MQKISTAMEDGLTESEVKEIQEVIAKYVNQDEYELLMKMITPDAKDNSQN
jgi:septum formation topological specificity factor MinE